MRNDQCPEKSKKRIDDLFPAIRKSLIYTGIFILVCAIVYFTKGATVEGRAFLHNIEGVPVGMLLGVLCLALLNDFIRALRFQFFARNLSLNVPLKEIIVYYFSGFAMGISPGKLGEVVRLWFLKKSHQVPYHKSLVLQVGDRASDVYATLLLCLIGMAHFANYQNIVYGMIAAFCLLSGLLVWPGQLKKLVRVGYGVFKKKPRLFIRLLHLIDNISFLFNPRIFTVSLFLGVCGWLAECVALYVLLKTLGAPISLLSAMFIFAFANLVGGISMLPGGLGSVELTIFGLLRLNEVPAELAVAATAIIRACTFWFGIGLGFIFLPIAMQLAKKSETIKSILKRA